MAELKNILEKYHIDQGIKKLAGTISSGDHDVYHLDGLKGASPAFIISALYSLKPKINICVLNEKEEAAYFFNDLQSLAPTKDIYFYPSSYKRSIQFDQPNRTNVVLRTSVLNKLSGNHKEAIIVTYPEALIEKVIPRKQLSENTLQLKVGEKISLDFILEVLETYHFKRSDFVFEPGQFSIRGSIVDIFSYAADHPYRIDFFGEEVESIRSFDIETQISKGKHRSISIIPNIQGDVLIEQSQSFFDFIPKNTLIWHKDFNFCYNKIQSIYDNLESTAREDHYDKLNEEIISRIEEVKGQIKKANTSHILKESLKSKIVLEFGHNKALKTDACYSWETKSQASINKNFDLLKDILKENLNQGITNYIVSENENQISRLQSILNTEEEELFVPLLSNISKGFSDYHAGFALFTDHQIFERYHKFRLKSSFGKKEALSIRDLTELHPGDYVVHVDHGIGQFGGLEKIQKDGKTQEAIRLVYRDKDILYVSIHSLHRISKYKGKDGSAPKIHKLGSGVWQRTKQKTKRKIKDIARELIDLYAQRLNSKGWQFSPDSFLQHELEASFIYEDTPDQVKATKAFKTDMEAETPMDRLVCGDVGFGKTEIAIRAAFKAVADSKQVAVLVPTTILALQHYKTFSSRFKDFPCTVDFVSRLKTTAEQKKSIKRLGQGETDIIIGTHRLVSKDIQFKDLGLLIIDEEQKFGVSVKEKLKRFKVNVDTLTLTATPIPRTLQFSLMGARDLSIINTPPPNRHPIITEVHQLNESLIREAIQYEIGRNGQVFFVHNRVENIMEVKAMLARICPDVKTVVAHGQMDGPELERRMLSFINGEYGVLLATTIIENGLDIPNANTIIINNAQNFGLSDLHQLRGRVGRSNKKAFCYLLAPPLHLLPADSRRRLQAIEDYSELGSGFNIALQDLDIRGAGNLLGSEQSGFIADIGFDAYHKILKEALHELKESEYKNLFKGKAGSDNTQDIDSLNQEWVSDCQIDTDLELLFPENYIENITERMKLYRQLDDMQNEHELQSFEEQLSDRFGPLPRPAIELLDVVRIRWEALGLGIEKIILKNEKLLFYFISNPESDFYKSDVFMRILKYVQHNPSTCKMKESNDKLSLSFSGVQNVQQLLFLLQSIRPEEE